MSQPPDVVAPPPRHPRFPLVDGMRGIAVLLVVLTHVAGEASSLQSNLAGRLLAHANIGVTIFFLISGFLLFRPFVAARGGGAPAPRVTSYAKRRALRILPAYWIVLACLALVPGAPTLGKVPVWTMITLTQTLPIHAGPACSSQLFGCSLAQTWSLGAEMTFYVALPVYVLLVERLTANFPLRGWAVAQALALTALATGSVLVAYVFLAPAPLWVGWTVTGTMLWFACGMGLAVLSVLAEQSRRAAAIARAAGRRGGALWAAALALYVGFSLWLPSTAFVVTRAQMLAVHLGFALISALLLAPVVLGDRRVSAPHRIAGHRLLAGFGLISYGVFLWHFPVVIALGPAHGIAGALALAVGTLAVSGLIAAATYAAVERPLLRLKYRPLRPRPWSQNPDGVRVSAP